MIWGWINNEIVCGTVGVPESVKKEFAVLPVTSLRPTLSHIV